MKIALVIILLQILLTSLCFKFLSDGLLRFYQKMTYLLFPALLIISKVMIDNDFTFQGSNSITLDVTGIIRLSFLLILLLVIVVQIILNYFWNNR
ncbi:MAG: hypothetical protein HYZ44_11550 [Bacteroidetes bacterium]|nr:hypothetical protein [Bacteroidota bacterium]